MIRWLPLALLACSGSKEVEEPEDTTTTTETADTAPWDWRFLDPPDRDDACWSWETSFADDEFEQTVLRVYDGPTSLLPLHMELDNGPNGEIDYSITTDRSTPDQVDQSIDSDGDGTVDQTIHVEYVAGTELFSYYERDNDGDGTVDETYVYINEDGRRTALQADLDADGQVDRWYTYTYDDEGREVRAEGDDGNDGSVEWLRTTTYDNATGPDGRIDLDEDNDGTVDVVVIRRYTGDGESIVFEEERSEGTIRVDVLSYNAAGDIDDRTFTFTDEDGTVTNTEYTYTYEAPARLSRLETVSTGASTLESRREYAWFCP